MFNGFKQYLFLVVDQETAKIITKCPSMSIANAVCKGILNSSVMVIHYPFMSTRHEINQYQDDHLINYQLVRENKSTIDRSVISTSDANVYKPVERTENGKPFDIVKIETVSEDWLDKRKLGNFRSNRIRSLELICERYMARGNNFSNDEIFFQYLSTQLPLVNEESDHYPDSIVEWANIVGINPRQAYQELKLDYDSTGIFVMRMHAIWNKYVDIINQIPSVAEFDKHDIFINLETEIKFGKR
jgi:hypothetical protein